MKGVVIRRKDNGWRALVQRCADAAKGARVRVGVFADKPGDGERSGADNVEVAMIHELGAPAAGIPQRSFVRSTVASRGADIQRLQKAVAVNVVKGTIKRRQGLGQIGAKVAAMMQQTIRAGIAPPLKDETIARRRNGKGGTREGTTALIDTGQLVSSLTFQVVE